MQIALKSVPCFIDTDIENLGTEIMRLQFAGISEFPIENGTVSEV